MKIFSNKVSWVPGDNLQEYHIVAEETQHQNTTTASFVLGFFENKLVLADNLKRGIEIAGGHVEPGETVLQAAIRETFEEIGGIVSNIRPFIRSTLTCFFDKPENYRYPFPVSHMEFYIAELSSIQQPTMLNEVNKPVFLGFEVVDNQVVFDTSGWSKEHQDDFNNKISNNLGFLIKIQQACLQHHNSSL